MKCLNCTFFDLMPPIELDLGWQPLANAYHPWGVTLNDCQENFPLRVVRCRGCGLAQLDYHVHPKRLFGKTYPYRQGQSKTWVTHLQAYVEDILCRWTPQRVLDVGANDGTLVSIWRENGVDAMGVDPAPCGPNVWPAWMGRELARDFLVRRGLPFCDLISANNVLAHVPDLDDFLCGVKALLAEDGIFTVEVPDWERSTWDQVYHEHLLYFTEYTLHNALGRRGLRVDRIERLDTHGGSLRAVCRHA